MLLSLGPSWTLNELTNEKLRTLLKDPEKEMLVFSKRKGKRVSEIRSVKTL